MNTEKELNQRSEQLASACKQYQPYEQVIDKNLLGNMRLLADNFKKDAENAKDENRLLRIGIIGQIKRGKSSFLNSLFFGGQDILPKAATPMTAALTRISYSEKPSAKVEFYTEKEWQEVELTASKIKQGQVDYKRALSEYDARKAGDKKARPTPPMASEEAKACLELVNMVQSSGIEVSNFLGKTETIAGVDKHSDLLNQLNEYVGAAGRFTPIVKSTELSLDIAGLKGIEVVDTPGMNDPVVSRARRTQDFIGQCDVIFFLSNCGQFLDRHDMGLLAQNIPNKGIDDIVLIGSLFDGVLLDEYEKYPSIAEALPAITRKLNGQARSNVESVCTEAEESDLTKALEKALPPVFISSRCLDLARKQGPLSNEEQHTLNQLNGMFSGFEFTPEILAQIANFQKVEAKLTEVRTRKDGILSERFDNLMQGVKRERRQLLEQIKADVGHKHKVLMEGDIEQLAKQQAKTIGNIETGELRIKAVFEKYRIQAEKALVRTCNELQQTAIQVKQVESHAGSREESYTTSPLSPA